MNTYECTLHVTGRATVTVVADSEDEAARKAEETDPWELEVEVTDSTCDDVEPLDAEDTERLGSAP